MKCEREKFGMQKALLFAVLFAALVFVTVGCASAKTHYVNPGESIQAAVNAADPDDIIIVRDGNYTENVNVNKRLTIQSENGYVYTIVQAANSSDHVFEITADYVNIIGFTVMGPTWQAGIYLNADYCNISCNNISNNAYGILLGNSINSTLMNNIASNNDISIILVNSSYTMLTNNVASNNSYGIFLDYSSNNTLTNNTMSGNKYNFHVYGEYLSHYIQNIDTSNKVDGKPIYYWINQKNEQIPNNAGYVGIVNSTDIIVRDLTLLNNSHGVLLVYSSNSKIENVKVLNNIYGIYLIKSNNNSITNNNASNNYYGIYLVGSNNNTLINNNASNNWMFGNGIYLGASSNNVLMNNIASNNEREGIILWNSSKNTLMKNNASNNECGISLAYSDNNTLKNNIAGNNSMHGIYLGGSHVTGSNSNTLMNNNMPNNNYYGIFMIGSSYNMLLKNNIVSNNNYGIGLWDSSNNNIYLNNFINNTDNVYSYNSNNIWNSTEEISYTFNSNQYTNYLGNYWDDYTGSDADKNGIGDTSYVIPNDNNDNYPLMDPWENDFTPTENIFDTEAPANPYPSIMGTHNGTITPSHNINVSKLYTYACVGTGGHTESIELYDENDTLIANGSWNGYIGDYHNITIHNLTGEAPYVTLLKNHEYRYVIKTGSYPQIIHEPSKNVTGGTITCNQFIDANGKTYTGWIPAIRLWAG